jgi:hypothetical protein
MISIAGRPKAIFTMCGSVMPTMPRASGGVATCWRSSVVCLGGDSGGHNGGLVALAGDRVYAAPDT